MKKREYLIVASDLDGTLLTDDKKLTDKNKEVIERLIENGGYFVPATGRPISGIPEFLKEIRGIQYIILSNGAAVLHMQTGEVIYKNQFEPEEAKEIIKILRSFGTMFDFYADGVGRIEANFLEDLQKYNIEPEIEKIIKKTRKPVESLDEFLEKEQCHVEKFNMFFSQQEKREEARVALSKIPNILVTSSVKNNLEINAATCNKGNALKALADYLGVDIEKTMAFGDNSNDIAMIKEAGLGVAMKNGSKEARAVSDYISEYSNNESGVGIAIEKWNTLL
ncbi:MAG: Cof-type HAD-IIB family hydrolase [Lachnospiraceae bacterium]